MATLREIREHIGSVSSIAKVTNAMQVVSAAQHQRLRDRVESTKGFAERSWEMLSHLAAAAGEVLADEPLFCGRAQDGPVALLLITSNRGMAGDFDQAIIAEALRFARQQSAPVRPITIGKYGREAMMRADHDIYADFEIEPNLTLEQVAPIARVVIDGFVDGTFDQVHIAYTEFQGGARFHPTVRQLLPACPTDAVRREYIYEPDPHTLLQELFPMILRFQLFQAMLESMTAETAARMVAMRAATRNAEDLITHLRSSYNRARQQNITDEMLDILGGSNAVMQTGG